MILKLIAKLVLVLFFFQSVNLAPLLPIQLEIYLSTIHLVLSLVPEQKLDVDYLNFLLSENFYIFVCSLLPFYFNEDIHSPFASQVFWFPSPLFPLESCFIDYLLHLSLISLPQTLILPSGSSKITFLLCSLYWYPNES